MALKLDEIYDDLKNLASKASVSADAILPSDAIQNTYVDPFAPFRQSPNFNPITPVKLPNIQPGQGINSGGFISANGLIPKGAFETSGYMKVLDELVTFAMKFMKREFPDRASVLVAATWECRCGEVIQANHCSCDLCGTLATGVTTITLTPQITA